MSVILTLKVERLLLSCEETKKVRSDSRIDDEAYDDVEQLSPRTFGFFQRIVIRTPVMFLVTIVAMFVRIHLDSAFLTSSFRTSYLSSVWSPPSP